jgi:DNA-binding transcriptional regulator GbsR (MarR family)
MSQEEDADVILREAMAALDMPRSGVRRFIAHLERFYRRHGAERHYGECLALLSAMRRVLEADELR